MGTPRQTCLLLGSPEIFGDPTGKNNHAPVYGNNLPNKIFLGFGGWGGVGGGTPFTEGFRKKVLGTFPNIVCREYLTDPDEFLKTQVGLIEN